MPDNREDSFEPPIKVWSLVRARRYRRLLSFYQEAQTYYAGFTPAERIAAYKNGQHSWGKNP